jgi:hypothetical protein
MSDKTKPALFAAFTEAARPQAPAARVPALPQPSPPTRAERGEAPRTKAARGQGERINLTYRATAPNWERLKHLAISDRVSVQELIHTALSREFERRGLPALDD